MKKKTFDLVFLDNNIYCSIEQNYEKVVTYWRQFKVFVQKWVNTAGWRLLSLQKPARRTPPLPIPPSRLGSWGWGVFPLPPGWWEWFTVPRLCADTGLLHSCSLESLGCWDVLGRGHLCDLPRWETSAELLWADTSHTHYWGKRELCDPSWGEEGVWKPTRGSLQTPPVSLSLEVWMRMLTTLLWWLLVTSAPLCPVLRIPVSFWIWGWLWGRPVRNPC